MDNTSRFLVNPISGFAVVEFQSSSLLDPQEVTRLSQQLMTLLDQDFKRGMVLDFTAVKFISSQVIGMLVAIHKRLEGAPPRKLYLCGLSPRLTELLQVTQLNRILNIRESQADILRMARLT